jgi:hypothetical protein
VYQARKILYSNMKSRFLSKNGVRFSVAICLAFGALVQVQARPPVTGNSMLNSSAATPSLVLAVLALVVLGFGSLVYRAAIRRR